MCAGSAIAARCSPDGMSERIVLATAFEPFGGEAGGGEPDRRLAPRRRPVVAARMLPCAYEACVSQFVEAFQLLRPSAVLMTGQAARRCFMVCMSWRRQTERTITTQIGRGVLHAICGPRQRFWAHAEFVE
jgi:hypothetical protein